MDTRIRGTYAFIWLLTAVIFFADFLLMRRVGLSISGRWLPKVAELCVLSGLICLLLFNLGKSERYREAAEKLRCRELAIAIFCILTIAISGQSIAVASYIGAALDRPLIDGALLAIERGLGFDWLREYHWIRRFDRLNFVLRIAYQSAFFQLAIFPVVLGLLRRKQELCEMMLIFAISAVTVVIIAAIYPAESPFVHFGISDPGTASTVSDFDGVRSGTLTVVDPFAIQGIVSLPSFHTVLALLLTYVTRNVRVLFPFAIALNSVMVISTFSIGGHYLADIASGAMLGAATIWCVRRWLGGYEVSREPALTS